MKIGFTNGCFDLLHDGHRHFLEQAKRHCEYLIVGIDTDKNVRWAKGEGRPFHPLETRIEALQALCSADVDAIVPFSSNDHLWNLIVAIAPDVLLKGSDYQDKSVIGSREVVQAGGQVIFIPRLPGVSTTEIAHASGRLS